MKYFIYTLMFLAVLISAGCDNDKDNEPQTPLNSGEPIDKDEPLDKAVKTILVYAVSSNNLNEYLDYDIREMKAGLKDVNLNKNRLFIYSVRLDNAGNPTVPELAMMVKSRDGYDLKTITEYDDTYRSTDKERITEVINKVREYSPSEEYGLIFWSHSSAWLPSPAWRAPKQYSFGQDYDGQHSHYCEIPDLADAVPDDFAEYIWFDSCYMSNIETAYEFRGKCRYFVGSALELKGYGQPYDLTLPVLLSDSRNLADCLTAAAKITNDYFVAQRSPVTMSVMDMSVIEQVAEATSKVMSGFKPLPDAQVSQMQCYSRNMKPRLFDFRQFYRLVARQNKKDSTLLDNAMLRFVIYKGKSERDFNNQKIYEENYSGLTCHAFSDTREKYDDMYRTLKWYRRVFQGKF